MPSKRESKFHYSLSGSNQEGWSLHVSKLNRDGSCSPHWYKPKEYDTLVAAMAAIVAQEKGEEQDPLARCRDLGIQILEHRYRYYVLDDPIVADGQYDLLEREYEELCGKTGTTSLIKDMVGFNEKSSEQAQNVAQRLGEGR